MTKAIYKRKHLIRDLLCFRGLVHDCHGAWKQAGRRGSGALAESLHFISKMGTQRGIKTVWTFDS